MKSPSIKRLLGRPRPDDGGEAEQIRRRLDAISRIERVPSSARTRKSDDAQVAY